jgi:hypothetical protein
MTTPAAKEPSARSPFAGCAIFIIALAVMMFLVVFSIFALFRQSDAISKFTSEQASPVEISRAIDSDTNVASVQTKLDAFHKQLDGKEESSLELAAEEINLIIASHEAFKELRGTFRIREIRDDRLHIAISFRLNGQPRFTKLGESGWITSDPRYLNGTMIARPALSNRELVLQIENIEVPGKAVPREFIEQMSPYRITERYLTDPTLGPAMAKLTRVRVSNGNLVLSRLPGEVPADVITNSQVDSARNRLFTVLGVVASLFLLAVGLLIFVGLRAKAAKA